VTRSTRKRLKRAERMFRRREYSRLVSYLEPQVFMFRESYRYYFLLGMSCLHTGDTAGAYSYLQRAATLEDDPSALLGLAAVFLKRRRTDEAIRRYLDILDLDADHRQAKRALQWLRAVETPEEALQWFESGRIRQILPRRGFFIPRFLLVLGAAVALVGVLVFFLDPLVSMLETLGEVDSRQGSEYARLDRDEELLGDGNGTRYVLDEAEIEEIFDRMRIHFADNRDNLVRRDINYIELSNASEAVRQRASFLRDYLNIPDFTTLRDNFEYTDVTEDPLLYRGTYVRWRGRVANLEIGDETIRFDLLVGYETGQVLAGIIPVVLDFAVVLRNNDPVELIGRVDLPDDATPELQVTSIRVLGLSEINQ